MQRKFDRERPDYAPKSQPTKLLPDGGYRTLRPTKGWITICGKRLSAGRRMAAMLDRVLPERQKKPAKVWRKPMAPVPNVETRQQRRWTARKGVPA